MAYPIEKTGVSSRIQEGVGDNVGRYVELERFDDEAENWGEITLYIEARGVNNQPFEEVEAGLRKEFEVALNEFRHLLGR